jgi:hypothetical protein
MTLWKKGSRKNGRIPKNFKKSRACGHQIHLNSKQTSWIPNQAIIISWKTFNQFVWRKSWIAQETANQTSSSTKWAAATATLLRRKHLTPLASQPHPLPPSAAPKPCKAPNDSNGRETNSPNNKRPKHTSQKPPSPREYNTPPPHDLQEKSPRRPRRQSKSTSRSLALLLLCVSASPSRSCSATVYVLAKSSSI